MADDNLHVVAGRAQPSDPLLPRADLSSDGPGAPPRAEPTTDSLGDRAARGTGITLAVQAARAVLQFAAVVLLARLLSPADFGLIAMVTAVIGVADLIRDFGLSLAAVRAPSLSTAERDNLFWANLGMGVACTLVILAAAPLIVHAYGEPRLTPVIMSLAVVFAFSGITTQYRAGLTREMRFRALGLTDISAQAVALGAAVALAIAGFGLWALVAQQLVSAVVTTLLCVCCARWLPGLPRRNVSIRPFMRFGIGVFGTQVVHYVTKNADNVAIGVVWGPTPLGLYSRAYQLMMMPLNQINAPMTQVALPILSRVQHDATDFASYLRKSQLVACYATCTLFAVAVGLSHPLVLVLFGQRWEAVVPIFAILGVGGVFRAVAQIAYWAYLAKGASGALFKQRLATGLFTLVCILAGLPWGPVGVAVGCTAASFVSWLVAVWHVGLVTGTDTRPLLTNATRILALVGTPCGAVAYVGTLLTPAPLLQLAGGSLLTGVYLALAYAVFPSVRADLRLTASFVRRSLKRRATSGSS